MPRPLRKASQRRVRTTRPARSNGKHPGGRPSKYAPAYCAQLIKFFSRPPYHTLRTVEANTDGGGNGVIGRGRQANDPPLLISFALKIGVSLSTLYMWERAHPEFLEALEQARALQERYYVTCGVLGLTNSTITALALKTNHGYREKETVLEPDTVRGLVQQLVIVIVEQLPKAQDRSQLVASLRDKLTHGPHA